MAGPGEEDQELSPEEASERDKRELENEVEKLQGREAPEPEDTDDDPEAYLEEEPQTRQQRRQARGQLRERNAELERELADMRAQRAAWEAQLRMQQIQAQQAAQPAADPREAAMGELKRLQQLEIGLSSSYQAIISHRAPTQEEQDYFLDQHRQIQLLRGQVTYEAAAAQARASAPPQKDPVVAMLEAEYADVFHDPVAMTAARLHYARALKSGAQDGLALFRESYEAGRAELTGQPAPRRQGARQGPTDASRARFAGVSTGGRAQQGAAAPVMLKREEVAAIRKAFPYIKDEKELLRKGWEEIVKPAREEASRGRQA